MRTTITLHKDVAAAVAKLQREHGIGVSEAVNELVRRGLARKEPGQAFVQETSSLGLRVDVTNIAEALDALEGSSNR